VIDRAAGSLLGTTADPVVSCDMIMRPESLIIAKPQTQCTAELLRLFGWYDNEWAFAHRMIDSVKLL